MKIQKNDKVKILSGKDKGKTGKVLQLFPVENRVVVEGLNLMKKNLKSNRKGEKGQIIELSAPIHVSRIKLVCPKCAKETRVGYKLLLNIKEDAKAKNDKVRICKKCKEAVN